MAAERREPSRTGGGGTEAAVGVEIVEGYGGEAAGFEEADGEGVAEGELHDGGGGGGEAVGAGFGHCGECEADFCDASQGAGGRGGDGDQRDVEAACVVEDGGEV